MFGLLAVYWLILTDITPRASVGTDASCLYHPDQFHTAIKKHNKLYLTNEFTLSGIEISQDKLHLVGGFDSCADINQDNYGYKRSRISGANEAVALTVDTKGNSSIILENFEIFDGYSQQAGGVEVVQVSRFILINSLVYGNVSVGEGGGIHIHGNGASIEILSSKIFDNSAQSNGGGISISGDYNVMLIKDTWVYSNQSGVAGGGLSCKNNNQINVFNHRFENELWLINNKSPMAANYFQDLTCQLQWSTNGRFGLGYVDELN